MDLNVLGYRSHVLQRWRAACGLEGSSHPSPFLAFYQFLSRCKFSTLTTRQPIVEFYLLAFSRSPLRTK